jgi:hypothetical protein
MPDYIIRGLKMSSPLALIRQEGLDIKACLSILQGLEGLRINLAYAAMTTVDSGDFQLDFCVDLSQALPAYNHTAPIALRHGLKQPGIAHPVVALDIFPRGKGLDFALMVEGCLLEAGAAPLALGTSLSAVVAVVAKDQVDKAVDALCQGFGLSKEAARLKERVSVVQKP